MGAKTVSMYCLRFITMGGAQKGLCPVRQNNSDGPVPIQRKLSPSSSKFTEYFSPTHCTPKRHKSNETDRHKLRI